MALVNTTLIYGVSISSFLFPLLFSSLLTPAREIVLFLCGALWVLHTYRQRHQWDNKWLPLSCVYNTHWQDKCVMLGVLVKQ